MSNTFIKPEKVVDVGLTVLQRELVLPNLVWRDAAGDFAGVKGDTITIRVPAYATARKNTLRSGASRTRDGVTETKVDVTLNTRIYKDIEITDEEFTLDIVDFTSQVMSPVLRSIVVGLEDEVADLMTGATYAVTLALDTANPYNTLVDARKALNDAHVPQGGRYLVVGSTVEAYILKAQEFVTALAQGGDASALRDAMTGRVAGFDVIVSSAIPPEEAYAFHRTAYALNTRAPKVPSGAPWGASMASNGFAIRAVQILDPTDIVNILATEAWSGTNIVQDHGDFDTNGSWVPATDPDTDNGTDLQFIRAVKVNISGS